MGFRFRKRVKLAPGVHLNLTGKGISSISVGTRGATVNVARGRPATVTVGIPGSGLSYRHTLGAKGAGRAPTRLYDVDRLDQPRSGENGLHATPQATVVRRVASWSNPRFADEAARLVAAYRAIDDARSKAAASRDALETAQHRMRRASAWYRRLIAPTAFRDAQKALEDCLQQHAQARSLESGIPPALDGRVPDAIATSFAELRRATQVAAGRMGGLVVDCGEVSSDDIWVTPPRRAQIQWTSCAPMPLGPGLATDPKDSIPGFRAENGDAMYLFPAYIVAFVAGEVGFVSWADLDFSCRELMEVGQGPVAADAPPCTFTWRHVRKDGNPDFRYKDNPRLPLFPFQRHCFFLGGRPAITIDYQTSYLEYLDFWKGFEAVRDWHLGQQALRSLAALPTLAVTWQRRSADGMAYLVASNSTEEIFGFGVPSDSPQLWMSIMAKPFGAKFVDPGLLGSAPRCEAWLDDFQLTPGRSQGYTAHVSAEQAAFRLWHADEEGREDPLNRLATASVLAVQVWQDEGSPIRFRLDLDAVRTELRETLRLRS